MCLMRSAASTVTRVLSANNSSLAVRRRRVSGSAIKYLQPLLLVRAKQIPMLSHYRAGVTPFGANASRTEKTFQV